MLLNLLHSQGKVARGNEQRNGEPGGGWCVRAGGQACGKKVVKSKVLRVLRVKTNEKGEI